jgi:hypothetical protein
MIVPTSGTTVGPGGSFEEVVSNQPTGLAGVIGVRIVDNAGTTVDPRRTAGITEQPADSGIYTVVLVAPAGAGQYSIIWDTDPAGVLSPTNSTVHSLTVITETVAPAADSLLCGLWLDPAALECDGVIAPVDATLFVQEACEFLYVASGYQYPGICTSTVRPCTPDCGCLSDGCWSCAPPYNVVKLYEPVVEIQSVTVNGEALAASEYRLYDRRYLQKTVGGWPWQNLILPPGEVGTWTVTFTHGAAPPLAGVLAAQDLACRISAGGVDCTLPPHVVSLARQGVNQVFDPAQSGVLSIPSVSSFLQAFGYGEARVWSPDLPPNPAEVI